MEERHDELVLVIGQDELRPWEVVGVGQVRWAMREESEVVAPLSCCSLLPPFPLLLLNGCLILLAPTSRLHHLESP